MVLSPPPTKNAFQLAYEGLNDHDKERMRDLVCISCSVSKKQFYVWLKDPNVMSKMNKYTVALLFDQEPAILFKPLNP